MESGPTDRRTKILSGLDLRTLTGLEIGPLDRPLVRRTDGQIVYIDHADTPALRAKYGADPNVTVSDLVEIDAVWGEKTLLEAVGRMVDYVVASHVIEHVPDLITWLAEIRDVLVPEGQLRLAVPDRRYTFDFYRGETRLADVVNAWFMKARKPLPHAILDFCLEFTEVDVVRAWRGEVIDQKPVHTLDSALSIAADARDRCGYHDVHCWVFTPDSFVRLMGRLAELGLIPFACRAFFEPELNTLEFIVHLDRCDDSAKAAATWKAIPARTDAQSPSAVQTYVNALLETIASLAEELAAIRNSAQAEADALRNTIASLTFQLDAIRNSTSWRATAPLRGLISGTRRTLRNNH